MSDITLLYLGGLVADKQRLLERLRAWGLIPNEDEYKCPTCNQALRLYSDASAPDGWIWTCRNYHAARKQKRRICGTRVSFRKGTIFERSHLSILQILGFVNLWVDDASLKLIARQLTISVTTCVNLSSFCREVLVEAFLERQDSTPLGGPGKIVEIDESQFGKRKYHRGNPVNGAWVFGAYECETGRVFMTVVENRSAATLISLIQKWIEPGTVVISDCWKAYDGLRDIYDHLTVNHSLTFKDPETGDHTYGGMESKWRAAKSVICGRRQAHLPGNLARYMFNKHCRQLNLQPTEEFFRLAGSVINPLIPRQPFDNDELSEYYEDIDE